MGGQRPQLRKPESALPSSRRITEAATLTGSFFLLMLGIGGTADRLNPLWLDDGVPGRVPCPTDMNSSPSSSPEEGGETGLEEEAEGFAFEVPSVSGVADWSLTCWATCRFCRAVWRREFGAVIVGTQIEHVSRLRNRDQMTDPDLHDGWMPPSCRFNKDRVGHRKSLAMGLRCRVSS